MAGSFQAKRPGAHREGRPASGSEGILRFQILDQGDAADAEPRSAETSIRRKGRFYASLTTSTILACRHSIAFSLDIMAVVRPTAFRATGPLRSRMLCRIDGGPLHHGLSIAIDDH